LVVVVVFHMLNSQQPIAILALITSIAGNSEQLKRSLVRGLEGLGRKVTISPATAD